MRFYHSGTAHGHGEKKRGMNLRKEAQKEKIKFTVGNAKKNSQY